jgi:protein-S-isoprenylcysteine O-methyltransferase Ste14
MNSKTGFLSILRTLVVYLLLPFVGWWISSEALWPPPLGELFTSFVSEPVRLAYLIIVVGVAIVTGASTGVTPVNKPIQDRSAMLHWRNIALEITMVLGPFSDHRGQMVLGDGAALRWVGLILFVIGMGTLLWTSELRNRELYQQNLTLYDPILLTVGPFRKLRYPDYLGQIIYMLGAALVFRSWIGLGSFLLVILFIMALIREEEKLARAKFGARWLDYSHTSWKLIPFIF